MRKYVNGTIRITIKDFGYRTDCDLKEAVLEALTKDLQDPKGCDSYLDNPNITIEV